MLTTLALGAALGCTPTAPAPERPLKVAATSAPTEGMCKEHGVLEALCTQCNPKLIPVFQAKGDWCAEHGFPESICPLCHPERGGRPAAEIADDGAPADGTKIRFKASETADLAGIQTVPAESRAGGATLSALASLSFDATRRAEVNPRAPGVIRTVLVEIGAHVTAGDALAVVESAGVAADQGRLRAAESRARAAEAAFERESKLVETGVSSRRDALAAQTALEEARAELDAVRAALGVVGGATTAGRYTLRAPIAGTVIRREAAIGRLVDAEEMLFEIADTATMWADIDLQERDAARVQVGQSVTFVLDAIPDREFRGRVDYLAPEVDRRTRTVRARATLPNEDAALRANMFGKARVALGGGEPALIVPRSAVQRAKGVPLVFVRTAQGEFEARRVKIGFADEKTVELLGGVAAGEAVATDGSFLLKTETLKGSIGAGCCDGD